MYEVSFFLPETEHNTITAVRENPKLGRTADSHFYLKHFVRIKILTIAPLRLNGAMIIRDL